MIKTNERVYAILKNAISNNYFSMSSKDNNESFGINKSLKYININYSADIENKFKQNYFLFHGSKNYSWYPIIKNGLKVMSRTPMMANGSAFGDGIYFSDSFEVSRQYSRTTHNYSIIGVFEISENPINYYKSGKVFVINNDKIILLRTLILVGSATIVPENISKYFLKELPEQKQINKVNIFILKNKRLNGEYKKLSILNFITNITMENETKWLINFIPIKNFNPFIELTFSNYPINPPIIKLLSTNIKISGLIDSNNNIMIDLINPANWKITNNLEEITTILYKCFQESI